MNRAFILSTLLFSLLLSGCATGPTEAQKADKLTAWRVASTPFENRPALYVQMEKEGAISPAKHQAWLAKWQEQKPVWAQEQRKKAEHDRLLASLTPAQRLDLEMRQKELDGRRDQANAMMALQAEQQRQASVQAFANSIRQNLAQQQAQQAAQQAQFNEQLQRNMPAPYQPPQRRTYNSTVTQPYYPGGPYQVRTEETGY